MSFGESFAKEIIIKELGFRIVVLTTKAVLLQIKCIFAQYYRDTISITDSFASFLGLVLLGDLEEAAAAQLSNYVNKSSSNEETFL